MDTEARLRILPERLSQNRSNKLLRVKPFTSAARMPFSPSDRFNWLDMIKTSLPPPSDPALAQEERESSVRCRPRSQDVAYFYIARCLTPRHWTESCSAMQSHEVWRLELTHNKAGGGERGLAGWLTLLGSQNTDLRPAEGRRDNRTIIGLFILCLGHQGSKNSPPPHNDSGSFHPKQQNIVDLGVKKIDAI